MRTFIFVFLLLAGQILPFWGEAEVSTPQPEGGQIRIEKRLPKGPFHRLSITLYGLLPNRVDQELVSDLLLTDPLGRRTGKDPLVGAEYEEIPQSAYVEESVISPMRELEVYQPADGLYLLRVIGTRRGSYELYLRPVDENSNSPNQPVFENLPILPRMVHAFCLEYTRTPGIPLKVWGGLVGGKEEPAEVDRFLTYASPPSSPATISAGKAPFPLVIFYGPSLDPSTFRAALNGRDISGLFRVRSGTYQVVPLRLRQGSNTLILSIQGKTTSGQKAEDRDQISILVR